MGKFERITITLPEEMIAQLRAAVQTGAFATEDDVVHAALRDWGSEQARKDAALEKMRDLIAEADAGPSYPAAEVFAELRSYVAEEAAKYRADQA